MAVEPLFPLRRPRGAGRTRRPRWPALRLPLAAALRHAGCAEAGRERRPRGAPGGECVSAMETGVSRGDKGCLSSGGTPGVALPPFLVISSQEIL